ncbi:hypothetical protein [Natronobiforma cellulositropha]|uniref:hypothetical protein n=1 Tax=Natronobiforma cellulositropha TaxID=1679076 RepID=UPI0021D5D348|nr:hypothetical protein [Natronobiforma cellulositropha]
MSDPDESGADPRVIRSLAVTTADVLDAFVYTRENPATAVVRVTPPFHGRMRARLHVYVSDDAGETGALHLEPAALLEDDVVAAYPAPAAGAGDAEPAGARYADAVDAWRERAREALVETVTLETAAGEHEVTVARLG